LDLVAMRADEAGDGLQEAGIVVDNENRERFVSH
jgi:hypothetical protein